MATITKTEDGTTVRTEWGVERTWPDGYAEYHRETDRQCAEYEVAHVAAGVTAQLVTRTVTTSPWTPRGRRLMPSFRKTESFIPTCPADGSDLVDAEDYVPHFENPWHGPDDPEREALRCLLCDPISLVPTDLAETLEDLVELTMLGAALASVIEPSTASVQIVTAAEIADLFDIPRSFIDPTLTDVEPGPDPGEPADYGVVRVDDYPPALVDFAADMIATCPDLDVREIGERLRSPVAGGPTRPAPDYVMALIEAWANGTPLDFKGCTVPSAVQALIESVNEAHRHAGMQAHRRRVERPVERSADGTERAGWPATLKTPTQWLIERHPGVRVLDDDGWRGKHGRPWSDPITVEEFEHRLAQCTQSHPVDPAHRKGH